MNRVLTGLAIGLGWLGLATVTAVVIGRVIRASRGPDLEVEPVSTGPAPLLGVVPPSAEVLEMMARGSRP